MSDENPIAYMRDLDGTGSFHVCAKGDKGAFAVYGEPHDSELLGALRFIMAFYEPGQKYLDTEAWKVAEASARAAIAKAAPPKPPGY